MTLLTNWPVAARDLEDLVTALAAGGASPAGRETSERCTQLEHALQCASLLRHAFPEDEELQVAGLLHDIGHVLHPGAPELHGRIGATWIAGLLGDRIASLVELHVDAKRYLISTDPAYRDRLSATSAHTLLAQGDVMTPSEIDTFLGNPHHRDAIVLRRADEGAKGESARSGCIGDWVPVLRSFVERAR